MEVEVDVILVECPADKKMSVIKVLRDIDPALSLPAAKTKAETVNTTVKEAVSKAEAEKLKKDLEDAGAIVKLKFDNYEMQPTIVKQPTNEMQPTIVKQLTNYEIYLKELGHTTENVVTEEIVTFKNKIKSLQEDIEKQKRENYRLSADIEKQEQKNYRFSTGIYI